MIIPELNCTISILAAVVFVSNHRHLFLRMQVTV